MTGHSRNSANLAAKPKRIINSNFLLMCTDNTATVGPFAGTVATVVGAHRGGRCGLRSRPQKTSRRPGQIQRLQRERCAMVNHFLTPLRELIKLYVRHNSGAQPRYNL